MAWRRRSAQPRRVLQRRPRSPVFAHVMALVLLNGPRPPTGATMHTVDTEAPSPLFAAIAVISGLVAFVSAAALTALL